MERETILYVSPEGRDTWSGRKSEPEGRDGPLRTLQKARDILRRLKKTGELGSRAVVYLRGGVYPIRRPIVFEPQDSAPVTYAAYPGETPVIDGGERIENWRTTQVNGIAVWMAELPDARAGHWYFRSLFVNGKRRMRARLPKQGFYQIERVPERDPTDSLFSGSDRFCYAPGDIRLWRNFTDVEVVVPHFWVSERLPLESLDEGARTVRSHRRTVFRLTDDFQGRLADYYVENVFEALSEPGEWYLDRTEGKLYYVPEPDETLENSVVVAPRIEQLLILRGNPAEERYVEYLRFEGITFAHGDWSLPSGGAQETPGEFPQMDLASAPQAACNLAGAVQLIGTRGCVISGCTIKHVGLYAVDLGAGGRGNQIIGNELVDLGAGGIMMNGADAEGPRALRTGHNRIVNNHIHAGGRVFHAGVGICSRHSFANEISHNEIHDLYYSGISCGWTWGYEASVSRDNRIEYNHIYDLGHGFLSDIGGIYTLGVQPGTVIRGNMIHDIEQKNYGGWAIYLDEGSSHILVEGNVCYDTGSNGFNQHYGRENIVRCNIFAFGRECQFSLSRAEDHVAFTFERNIVITAGVPFFSAPFAGHMSRCTLVSDLNLYWDVQTEGAETRPAGRAIRNGWTLARLQEFGYDTHSRFEDPRCRSLRDRDFALAEGSPAFALGFKPLDHARSQNTAIFRNAGRIHAKNE